VTLALRRENLRLSMENERLRGGLLPSQNVELVNGSGIMVNKELLKRMTLYQ